MKTTYAIREYVCRSGAQRLPKAALNKSLVLRLVVTHRNWGASAASVDAENTQAVCRQGLALGS
jgi:hypothetical protein